MSVVLGPAAPGDADDIAAILTGWIDETDWMPRIHAPGAYLDFAQMLIGISQVTVARSAGRVCGFLALQERDIQSLYLRRNARGLGTGSQLLDHVKSANEYLGLWTFQANSGARRFYQRHGFHEDQRTNGAGNDEKIPDIHLIWEKDSA